MVLRRAWGSLLFISLVAGLGGSIVATALLGAERTHSALPRAIAAADPPTARVESDSHSSIDSLAALPGVRALHPLELYPGRVEGSSADVTLIATPDAIGRTIDRVDLDQGRLPDPEASDEALLTRVLADTLGIGVGDEFAFAAVSPSALEVFLSKAGPGDQELQPGPQLTMRIVGIGDYMVDRVERSESNATAYVSMAFSRRHASDAGHFGGSSGHGGLAYLWLGQGGAKALADVADRAKAASPDAKFEALADLADPLERSDRMLAEGVLVFVVAAGAALIAGIAIAVTRHLSRSRVDHAILASIGASRRTIVGLGAAETIPAAALAGVLAGTVTLVLARFTPFGASARSVDPDSGASPGLLVLVGAGAVVAALTVALAAAAAMLGSRPQRTGESRARATPMGWVSAPVAAAAGIRFALARGSGARRVPVLSALVAGIMGVAGIAGGLAYADNLRGLEHDTARWGWTWSVLLDVYFDDAAAEANTLATGRDDIAGWALITDVETQVEGIAGRAMSFDVLGGSLPLTLREGRLPASPDEAVLGAGLARQTHRGVGATIRMSSPSGDIPITVVGVATLYPNDTNQLASPSVLLTAAGLDRVAIGEKFVTLAFRAADGITPQVLYSRLAEVIGPDTITPTSYALADPPMEIAHITQLRPVPLALGVFFSSLALALVGNALLVTPRRRGAELAVLRALGLRPGQAASAVWWQAITIAAVSLSIGLPLGLIASRIAFARLARDALVAPGPLTTPSLVAIVIAATVAIALLLAVWPGRQAAVLPVARSLRAE